jgi:Resolvase, N terminal domain/Recombinase zinc beta ribbon domain
MLGVHLHTAHVSQHAAAIQHIHRELLSQRVGLLIRSRLRYPENMEKPRRVLSLLRVSGNAQIDRTGLPRQTASIAQICKAENLVVRKGDEYRYEGLSGASVDKFPKYLAMLERLSDPKISGIVFSEVSRLFRPEFVDQLSISKPFRVNGKFMFYEEGVLDLRKDRDQKLFIELAMEAGAYRKQTIKNTQWGRNERRRFGDCKSDPLPEGVKFVPHPKIKDELVTGHFQYTHDFYSDRVVEAFRRVLAGQSLSKIARDLKFGKPGRPNPNVVRNLLRSHWWIGEKASLKKRENYGLRDDGTMYGGYRATRKEPVIVPAKFDCADCPTLRKSIHEPPLVSREDFHSVQKILDAAHKTWTRQKASWDSDESPFLGQGVLVCHCGMKLYTKPNKLRNKKTFYYRCSSYNNKHTPCGAPHLHQHDIDGKLNMWASVMLVRRDYLNTFKPMEVSIDREGIKRQIAELEKVKAALYSKIGRYKDQALLDKMIDENETQVTELSKEMKAEPVKVSLDVEGLVQKFRGFWSLPLDERKRIFREAFRRIEIGHDGEIQEIEFINGTVIPFVSVTEEEAAQYPLL